VNVQEYISSGIIESYVLGLASPEERAEFEKNCSAYPEVKAAREAFELLLEKQAMKNAVPPPPELKHKITEAVRSEGKVIPLPSAKPASLRKINWAKYVAAACLVLLAGSAYWNLTLQQQNKNLKTNLNESSAKLTQLEQDLKILQGNPAVKMVGMGGTAQSPHSFATVYWDTTSKDVYLLVNNLPKPASDQQYQLWALLNGEPIDMGFIEITEKPLQLYRMENAQAAQAFAITLEKKGRSSVKKPEGPIYVLGNL